MTELVVLADTSGNPSGTADKAEVHTADTPLHFAFSCWAFRGDDVLISRRALTKKTWPGVWTNSFCGHPAPGEATADAVLRRALFELGIDKSAVRGLECVAPDYSYRATDSSGIVENEICPVYRCELAADADISPRPDEVDSYVWVPAEQLREAIRRAPFAFSPWMVEEIELPGVI